MKKSAKLMLVLVVGLVMGGTMIAQKPQRTNQKVVNLASHSVFLDKNTGQPQNSTSRINRFSGSENKEQFVCSPLVDPVESVVAGNAESLFSITQTPPYDYFIVNLQRTVF